MKLKYLTTAFTGIIIGAALLSSCTKKDNNDDFPHGDVPPSPGGYTASSQIAPTNLVAFWNFNDDNIKDSVSNTSGTNVGMTFSEGLKGKALTGNPDGTKKAYATAIPTDAIKNMKQYTVTLWINTPQNTGATGLFTLGDTQGFWGNINLFLEGGGTITNARFKSIFKDNGVEFDTGVPTINNVFNKWVAYAASYDGAGTFRNYVNGNLVGTNTVANLGDVRFLNVGPIIFGTLQFMTVPISTTGATAQDWAGYIPGKIDEVRVYNRALKPIEIEALAFLERQGL